MNGAGMLGGGCPIHGLYVGRICPLCSAGADDGAAIAWPPLMAPATSSNWPANDAASSSELRVEAPRVPFGLLEADDRSAA